MKQINPIELQQLLQQHEEILLIDVREPHEREVFHIGGEPVPLDEVMPYAAHIPRNKPVVFYCRKGIRSQIAIQKLEEKFGFTNLINLTGGIDAWTNLTR